MVDMMVARLVSAVPVYRRAPLGPSSLRTRVLTTAVRLPTLSTAAHFKTYFIRLKLYFRTLLEMKLQLVIVALAALLMPAEGALRQCAGASNNRYESSGFLTADFTQKACRASGGSIDPNKRGNQKCCNVPDANKGAFTNSCMGQQAGGKYPGFGPIAQAC